jgi:hypothetical protein
MSKSLRSHLAWLVLACAAAHGCREECPPDTTKTGDLCVFSKPDAGHAVAAVGGSGASLLGGDWSCMNVGPACVCKRAAAAGSGCATPLPPCCFTTTGSSAQGCECWPSNSSQCVDAQSGQATGATLVSSCPPQ